MTIVWTISLALLAVIRATAPANDVCSNAQSIPAGTVAFTTIGATSSNAPDCGTTVDSNTPDVWFKHTATQAATLVVSTCHADTNFDTKLYVYNRQCAVPFQIPSCVGGNDDSSSAGCGTKSAVNIRAEVGTTYHIRIRGKAGATGSGKLTLSYHPFPTYDRCADNAVAGIGENPFDTTLAYVNPYSTAQCGAVPSLESPDVWLTFTAPADATLRVHTCGLVTFTHHLYVYKNTDCQDNGSSSIYAKCHAKSIASSTVAACNGLSGQSLELVAEKNARYTVRVVGVGGSRGTGIFKLEYPVVTKMCPGVGSVIAHGEQANIEIEIDRNIVIKTGTKTIKLRKCCGTADCTNSANWADAATSQVGGLVSNKKLAWATGYAYEENCDYLVVIEDGALQELDLEIITDNFKYGFTTRTASLTTEPFILAFTIPDDVNSFNHERMLAVIEAFNCQGSGSVAQIETQAQAGSSIIYIRFTNLAPGTAASVKAFLQAVTSNAAFNTQLQIHGFGSVIAGSVQVTAQDPLENLVITNSPSTVGAATVVTIAGRVPTGAGNGLPANGKITITFPFDFVLSTNPTDFDMQITCTSCGGGVTLTTASTAPAAGNKVTWEPLTAINPGDTFVLEIFGATLPDNCRLLNQWIWSVQFLQQNQALNNYYLGNPPTDTCHGKTVVVFGDPHFKSFSGGYFDISGTAGVVYNIISDQFFVWNAMFVSDDKSMRNNRHNQRMNTFLGLTGIYVHDHFIELEPHDVKYLIDGQQMEPSSHRVSIYNGTTHGLKAYYIKREPKLAIIRVPGFRIALKAAAYHGRHNENKHFDHAIDLIVEEVTHPHGLLGQTVNMKEEVHPVDHRGTGIIEGLLSEYIMGDIQQVAFRYARYGMDPMQLQEQVKHWSHAWFSHMNTTDKLKSDGFAVVQHVGQGSFWVTNVENFHANMHNRRTAVSDLTVRYLTHRLFEITVVVNKGATTVKQIDLKSALGGHLRLSVDATTTIINSTAIHTLRPTVVGAVEGNGLIMVEEVNGNGHHIVVGKMFEMYVRKDNPVRPYYSLQLEIHDMNLAFGSQGLFVQAMKSSEVSIEDFALQ